MDALTAARSRRRLVRSAPRRAPALARRHSHVMPAAPGRAAGLPPGLAQQASGKIADGRQGFCAAATHRFRAPAS